MWHRRIQVAQGPSFAAVGAGVVLVVALLLISILAAMALRSASHTTGPLISVRFGIADPRFLAALVVVSGVLFIGGFTAGRLSGSRTRRMATMHGFLAAAMALLLVPLLSAAFPLTFAPLTRSISTAPTPAPEEIGSLDVFWNEVVREFSGGSAGAPGTVLEDLRQGIVETASAGDEDQAAQVITEATGASADDARERLRDVQRRYDEIVASIRRSADEVRRITASTALGGFLFLLAGTLAGAAGGALGKVSSIAGAGTRRRVTQIRQSEVDLARSSYRAKLHDRKPRSVDRSKRKGRLAALRGKG